MCESNNNNDDDDVPFVSEGTVAGLAKENRRLHAENTLLKAYAKDRNEEVERLRAQCAGLAQSAMNNGQDLLLKEAEITAAHGLNDRLHRELKFWREKADTLMMKAAKLQAEIDEWRTGERP